MIVIDGEEYGVPVLSLTRNADFLDRYAERSMDGNLKRDLIGVYFNYQLKLGGKCQYTEYARLWDKLTEPVEFHTVTVPDEDGNYTFTAYISNVSDELSIQYNGHNYFKNLTVNFTAKSPARS